MISDTKDIIDFFHSHDFEVSVHLIERNRSLLSEASITKIKILCHVYPEKEYKLDEFDDIRQLIDNKEALDIAKSSNDVRGIHIFGKNVSAIYRKYNLLTPSLNTLKSLYETITAYGDLAAEYQADVMSDIGGTYFSIGDIAKAKDFLTRAYDIALKVNSEVVQMNCLVRLTPIHVIEGNHWEALKNHDMVLEFNRRKEYPGIYDAGNYESKGLIYKELAKYDKAMMCLLHGIAAVGLHPRDHLEEASLASLLGNLSVVYTYLGLYDDAATFAARRFEVAISQNDNFAMAMSLGQLGIVFLRRNHLDDALRIKRQMLEISNRVHMPPIERVAHQNLAIIQSCRNDDNDAKHHLASAIKITCGLGESLGLEQLWILCFLSRTHSSILQFFSYYFMKELRVQLKISLSVATVNKWMSSIEFLAENVLKAANAPEQLQRDIDSGQKDVREFCSSIDGLTELIDAERNPFSFMAPGAVAFDIIESVRAQGYIEKVNINGVKLDDLINNKQLVDEKAAVTSDIVNLQVQLQNSLLNADERTEFRQKLGEALERRGFIDKEILKEDHRIGSLQNALSPAIADIQSVLSDDEVFIEFFLTDQRVRYFAVDKYCYAPNPYSSGNAYLFVISKNTFNTHACGRTENIEALTNQLIGNIAEQGFYTNEEVVREYSEISYRLYKTLFGAAQQQIASYSKLIIAPDGLLNFLPMELLTMSKTTSGSFNDLEYAGRHLEIQYTPSARLFFDQRTERTSPPKLTKVTFVKNSPYNSFANIETTEEINILTALILEKTKVLPSVSVLSSGERWGKSEILNETVLSGSSIIHFSCHGVLNDDHSNGALVLGDSADDPFDNIISANEILELKTNADLVVMSACQTAAGNYERGDGIDGLVRSWYCAGAQSVVASLWRVSDMATIRYMESLYSSILSGDSIRKANIIAKRKMMSDEDFSAPYYWAAFVAFGSCGKLDI